MNDKNLFLKKEKTTYLYFLTYFLSNSGMVLTKLSGLEWDCEKAEIRSLQRSFYLADLLSALPNLNFHCYHPWDYNCFGYSLLGVVISIQSSVMWVC